MSKDIKRFRTERTPTIMDGLVIRHSAHCTWANVGEISASRRGVLLQGCFPLLQSVEDVEAYCRELRVAWDEVEKIRAGTLEKEAPCQP